MNIPIINPAKIIDEAQTAPIAAAYMCQLACAVLGVTNETKTRELVTAAYHIAFIMKDDKSNLAKLAAQIEDKRSLRGVPKEKVFDDPIHYLFIYIFYQSRMRTRARASEYAQGLRDYLTEGRLPDEVRNIIMTHGPDRLRLAAQRRQKLIQGAQEWAKKRNDSNLPTMDQILAEIVEEKAKKTVEDDDDDTSMIGSRALPPDLLSNSDIESDPDEEKQEDDEELDSEENQAEKCASSEEEGEKDQPLEFDDFFQGAVRMTAQLVVGLHQTEITSEKRDELVAIVMELTGNIIRFRGRLA